MTFASSQQRRRCRPRPLLQAPSIALQSRVSSPHWPGVRGTSPEQGLRPQLPLVLALLGESLLIAPAILMSPIRRTIWCLKFLASGNYPYSPEQAEQALRVTAPLQAIGLILPRVSPLTVPATFILRTAPIIGSVKCLAAT